MDGRNTGPRHRWVETAMRIGAAHEFARLGKVRRRRMAHRNGVRVSVVEFVNPDIGSEVSGAGW